MGCNSCGSPSISYPTPTCENCLRAPRITWACDQGPVPGDVLTFDIKAETDINLPTGAVYVFSIFDYDHEGINSVTITAQGVITINTKKVFNGRKRYRVRYKIKKVNGKESVTGSIYFCMQNACATCQGMCDPLYGNCLYITGRDTVSDCNETTAYPLSDWVGWGETEYLAGQYQWIGLPDCITPTFSMVGPTLQLNMAVGSCLDAGTHTFQLKVWNGSVSYTETFSVIVNDKCANVICGLGTVCNKCTGDCDSISGNVSIDGSGSTGSSGTQGNVIIE